MTTTVTCDLCGKHIDPDEPVIVGQLRQETGALIEDDFPVDFHQHCWFDARTHAQMIVELKEAS